MNEPKLIINTSLNNRGEKTASTKAKAKLGPIVFIFMYVYVQEQLIHDMYSQPYMQYYDYDEYSP